MKKFKGSKSKASQSLAAMIKTSPGLGAQQGAMSSVTPPASPGAVGPAPPGYKSGGFVMPKAATPKSMGLEAPPTPSAVRRQTPGYKMGGKVSCYADGGAVTFKTSPGSAKSYGK